MSKATFKAITLTIVLCLFSLNAFAQGDLDNWTDKSTPLTNWLFDVWGSSNTDVYAVGNEGRIFHYDGSWSSIPMDNPDNDTLYGIWGASATDIFAVGANGTILHFDGVDWTEMDSGTPSDLNDIWGVGSDVFAVGDNGKIVAYDNATDTWDNMTSSTTNDLWGISGRSATDIFAVGNGGTIVHYDGVAWSPISSGTIEDLRGVWTAPGNNVIIAGYTGIMLRYEGSEPLTVMTSAFPSEEMFSVWGTSDNDTYAVGFKGTIQHYNGSDNDTWTSISDPNGVDKFNLFGVWGSSSTDIFAVGLDGTVKRYDGVGTLTEDKIDDNTIEFLWGVWGSSTSNVFAVGKDGLLARYNGSDWTQETIADRELHDIWGNSESDVYAVGRSGRISHYDGNNWSSMTSNTSRILNGVWGSSDTDVYAVGDNGTIQHYNGSEWSSVKPKGISFTTRLYSVFGTSLSNVFVVGDAGTVLRTTDQGQTWDNMTTQTGTTSSLRDIWAGSATDVFVVGTGGTVLHYDNSTWETMVSGTTSSIYSIWGSSSTDVFAAQNTGMTVLHYDGNDWELFETPLLPDDTDNYLNAIWGTSWDNFFVVGIHRLGSVASILHHKIRCVSDANCNDGNDCTDDVCNAEGDCINTNDDTNSCDDGVNCTENDACSSGTCSGTLIDCSGLDDDCNVGYCDESDGTCDTNFINEGGACDDGLFCTENTTCSLGVCGSGNQIDCSVFDDDCNIGTCNETSQQCEAVPANEGGSCNDGDNCTENDTCASGVCAGTAIDCSSLDDDCNEGVCNEADGQCEANPINEGGACDDGLYCNVGETCSLGVCGGGSGRDCSAFADQCNTGECDEGLDTCYSQPANEGGACNDSLYCNVGETCSSGVCGGGTARDCSASADQCNTGECDEVLDTCFSQPANDNDTCNDGIACTENDTCSGGLCSGSANNDLCDDSNVCTDDTCNPSVGCEYDSEPLDGVPCDGGDLCDEGECKYQYTLTVEIPGGDDFGSAIAAIDEYVFEFNSGVTKTKYFEGDQITLTANINPDSEYGSFVKWGNGLNDFSNPVTLTTNADIDVKAIFIDGIIDEITTTSLALDPNDPFTYPTAITETMPNILPYGLIDLRLEVEEGKIGEFDIILPEAAPLGAKWTKCNEITGCKDFSFDPTTGEGAIINGNIVTVYIQDNGENDDNDALGIINDPSGLGVECLSNGDCPSGEECNQGVCEPKLSSTTTTTNSSPGGGSPGGGTPPATTTTTSVPPTAECSTDADCDNDIFCDGDEICINGLCIDGEPPCEEDETCDDDNDVCIPPAPAPDCIEDADCDDGEFCNGVETCVEGECAEGSAACFDDQLCNETLDMCIDLVTISASASRKLLRPAVRSQRCTWLRLQLDESCSFDSSVSTVTALTGPGEDYRGVTVNASKKISQGLLENVLWIPLCIDADATTGQWTLTVETDMSAADTPFIETIEVNFKIK